ncbi:hypothetical protein M4D58_23825 [Brevibacillus borstelensis]|uniref:hypothetical protein n=1 Tax=Brevibacillus borstelensis TaxID=45462 RepID=UPI00204156D0|nr:hypothetical protein [Brevibacillus borstelensis]MCM3593655.1 hypothetical protein [Brevibacillus borstelensis]
MSSNALTLQADVGFTPADLFTSAMSLASNFWPFLLLGLAFVVGPWIYGILVSALKKAISKRTA